MARRRMIDPNFWQSEDVSKLSIRQRLLLIGLFSNADDEGKLRGNPAYVRSAIFPYEDFTLSEIEEDLNKIESICSIQQYEVEGSKYIRLINWKKFQRVDKPQSSVIPDHINIHSDNDSKNDSEIDSRLKERKGREDKGKEEKRPSHNFLSIINKLNLKCKGIWEMEQLESFLTTMVPELIEEALKRSEQKGSVAYAIGILSDWLANGFKTLADIKPKRQLHSLPMAVGQAIPNIDETRVRNAEIERLKEQKRIRLKGEIV